jgi:hypothetical protein
MSLSLSVGRTPWSAADALVGLPASGGMLIPLATASVADAQTRESAPQSVQNRKPKWHWGREPAPPNRRQAAKT